MFTKVAKENMITKYNIIFLIIIYGLNCNYYATNSGLNGDLTYLTIATSILYQKAKAKGKISASHQDFLCAPVSCYHRGFSLMPPCITL